MFSQVPALAKHAHRRGAGVWPSPGGHTEDKRPPGESEAHFPKGISHFSGKKGVENTTKISTGLPTALSGLMYTFPQARVD